MEDKQKVLDLDDLFGDSRPVKVKFGGNVYDFMRLEAFTPREINMIQRLHKDALELQRLKNAGDGKADKKIEKVFDQILRMLCKDLPLEQVPFLAKTRIITFYIEETQGKKALEEALVSQPIGESSSVN